VTSVSDQGSPPRVLLVEDNPEDRQLVRELLETEGIEVVGEAPDGAVGVRLAAELEPDVVLMDLRLPGMSGLEATRQIKKILPLTQVITLTASEQLLAWDAAKAGVYAYLDKHRAPAMLPDVVHQARRLKVRLEGQGEALEDHADPDPATDEG
jgi:two-component system, NarL family, response regulator LiaR